MYILFILCLLFVYCSFFLLFPGSFAGLGFLSLYFAGKLELFNGRGHVSKLAIVFTPLLAALLVGLSRVDDYWHHWQDVFGGAVIGM